MIDPSGSIWRQLLVLAVLIGVNAFFAASEISVLTLNDNKLRKMAEDGDKKAKLLTKLSKNTSRFIAVIQVGVTLSGFTASAVAARSFTGRMMRLLASVTFIPQSVLSGLSVALITLLLCFVTLVLGELVPKRMAVQKPEKVAFFVARPLSFLAAIARPFVWLLTAVANPIVRLFGFDPDVEENQVTEEEILMLVDAGEEKGVIEESEKEMINNIFEFGDQTADEIMTHRTDVEALENTATLEDAVALAISGGYSRIPIFEEDIDTVLGVLYIKHLLQYVGKPLPEQSITDLMRPAYFIPEGKKCKDLFNELVDKKLHMAIVVDEYGGTAGIVTMEDLLESIVGSIQDEFDDEEEDVTKISDNTFTIDGTMYIDEVEDLLDQELPQGEYDTIAGMVVDMLGRIPTSDEAPAVMVGNVTFTVLDVVDNRITKLMAVVDWDGEESEGE